MTAFKLLWLPEQIHRQIKIRSAEKGMTMSGFVSELVSEDKNEGQDSNV